MSDGALSQAELDALLSGGTSGGAAQGAPGDAGDGGDVSAAIQGFLSGIAATHSSNLSAMTGGTVTVSLAQVSQVTRDSFLLSLPDTVTAVKADFSTGFPGEHTFIMGEDTAKAVAGLLNKEESITLDETAMSMLTEAVSQITGAEITALTGKTGNKSIASVPPEAANIPKATAALPAGNFFAAAWNLDLGDGGSHQLWEVYGGDVSRAIAQALKGPAAAGSAAGGGGMGGGGMGGMGGMGGGGFGQPSSVQAVQFPNLAPQLSQHEQTNIGLLMDVPMEMTVELGRTKKMIQEILGMGEGTIIELDKLAGEPVDILVNRKLIAKGEVVVIDENFGVRVTEIVSPMERMADLA
jgi:flagellar motor switch protein FliN/FliY